ncbi:hypothetical protein [Rossellomorea marisflavi]|uniref:hypothetical protein n=1 Tax=Rossellomorea marisflavi TaxID=189381 RepID=UPI0015C43EB5|nr:hypothetical protein [Rossellomorea marisflavi]
MKWLMMVLFGVLGIAATHAIRSYTDNGTVDWGENLLFGVSIFCTAAFFTWALEDKKNKE